MTELKNKFFLKKYSYQKSFSTLGHTKYCVETIENMQSQYQCIKCLEGVKRKVKEVYKAIIVLQERS